MIVKAPGRTGRVLVTFSMPAAIWADTIHLVGDFNQWNQRTTPLRLTEAGWCVTLELDAGCAYHYRYLVNGSEWHNDWQADRYEPNEFGGDNSVVLTELPGLPGNGNHPELADELRERLTHNERRPVPRYTRYGTVSLSRVTRGAADFSAPTTNANMKS